MQGMKKKTLPPVGKSFRKELGALINKYSLENGSDTPDRILAGFLIECLRAFDIAVTSREFWYGRLDEDSECEIPENKIQ